MIEMDDPSKRDEVKAQSHANARSFLSRGHIVVKSINSTVRREAKGGQRVGYSLTLTREDRAHYLRTNVDIFGQVVRSVSRDAWKLSKTPRGRKIIANVVAVGNTRPYPAQQTTIFSLRL